MSASLGELVEGLEQSRNQVDEASKPRNNTIAELKSRILAGESTGDPVKDFVIAQIGYSPDAEKKLSELYQNLQKHDGQIMMLEQRASKHGGTPGCFGGGWSDHAAQLTLGRIKSPYLIFEKPDPAQQEIDPVQEHLRRVLTRTGSKLQIASDPTATLSAKHPVLELYQEPVVVSGQNIPLDLYTLLMGPRGGFGRFIAEDMIEDHHPHSRGSTSTTLDVYNLHIGNKEVDNFFRENRIYSDKFKDITAELYGELFLILAADEKGEKLQQWQARNAEATNNARLGKIQQLALELYDKRALYLRTNGEDDRSRREWAAKEIKQRLEEGIKIGMLDDARAIQLPDIPGVRLTIGQFANGLKDIYKVEVKEPVKS